MTLRNAVKRKPNKGKRRAFPTDKETFRERHAPLTAAHAERLARWSTRKDGKRMPLVREDAPSGHLAGEGSA